MCGAGGSPGPGVENMLCKVMQVDGISMFHVTFEHNVITDLYVQVFVAIMSSLIHLISVDVLNNSYYELEIL